MDLENDASRAIVRALVAIWLVLLAGLGTLAVAAPHATLAAAPYSQFLTALQNGTVRAATLDGDSARWLTSDDREFVSRLPGTDRTYLQLLRARGVALAVVPPRDPMELRMLPLVLATSVLLLILL